MRSARLDQGRSRISPVPSRLGCRVCIETTSGSGTCSRKQGLLHTFPSTTMALLGPNTEH
jgi:hypothetical protein